MILQIPLRRDYIAEFGAKSRGSSSRCGARSCGRSLASKRDVVFQVVELAGGLLGRRRSAWLGRAWLRGARLGRRFARLARAGARAEHLHLGRHDLGGVALLAILVLPLARAQ